MTSHVVKVEPFTSVVEAARVMTRTDIGPLPVVEGDRLVGIVTDRDLVSRVLAEGRDPNEVTVREVASTDLLTTEPDRDVDEVLDMLAERQLDRILVVEQGRLVGILSKSDVAHYREPASFGKFLPARTARAERRNGGLTADEVGWARRAGLLQPEQLV
jgi:CBS domain-containing protein